MNLLCGSNFLDQNSDTLYQFEEGQRAHTIKFMSIPIKKQPNLNSINNNRLIKKPRFDFPKNKVNQNISKELILKKKTTLESNKCSNNTSELEIIEYPINEYKKNDFKNINDIITSKAKDYINDKSQNDILDYLKEKQGLSYLTFLFENDKNSNKSNSDKNIGGKKVDNSSSSKSDEIICSYVEIDHNNSIMSRMQKEKSVIKKPSKIFQQIHQSSYSDYSLVVKNYDSCKNKMEKNTSNTINLTINNNNTNKSKNKNEDKKIKVIKNIKKNKTDMKFKKSVNYSNTNANTHLKKNKKLEKERIKSFMELGQNDNLKISDIFKSNKKKSIFDKKNRIDTLRSIESLNNINPIHSNYKNILNTINAKPKKSAGKSQIINSERTISNFQLNRNLNSIIVNSKDKDYNHLYKGNKGNSINNKAKKLNINSKSKIAKNKNPLFNSINIQRSKNLNIKKANFLSLKKSLLLSSMRTDSINKLKTENTSTANSKSKLRKLLINNMINTKHKCDLSMYNINSITNHSKLIIKKDNNKALNKIMNRSEANKNINHSIQIKNHNNDNNNNKHLRNNFLQTSISKLLKG